MRLSEHWTNYKVSLYMSLPKKPVNIKEQKLRDKKQIINTIFLLIILSICLLMSLITNDYSSSSYLFLGFMVGDLIYLYVLIKRYL